MYEALQYFSRLGPFKKKIKAIEINSREYYRDIFPLICPDTRRPVTWVKGNFKNGVVTRRSHFRILSGKMRKTYLSYSEYIRCRNEAIQSDEHKKAKQVIFEALAYEMSTSKKMFWSFAYSEVTDFYFKGNILFNAEIIKEEYYVKTVFDKKLFLDIAVLCKAIDENSMVLFGIEIEKKHQFSGLKTILCKSIGFPFISIDISDLTLEQINIEWAKKFSH